MKNKMWRIGGALCGTLFLAQTAWTQPDPNDAPKAANPPENNRGRANRGQFGGGNAQQNRQRAEEGMRRMLAQAGVNDAPTQDIILEFVRTDMEARRPLREQASKLWQATRNNAVTGDQLLALVTDYRAAQEAEKARREKAETDLDAKVNFSKNPRLEAMLLLGGLIGDGTGGMFMGGMGGMGGGRGGQRGGNERGGNQRDGNDQRGGDQQRERGRNRPEMTPEQRELIQQKRKEFDKDNNGELNEEERAAFNQWRRENRPARPQGDNQAADADDAEMPDA